MTFLKYKVFSITLTIVFLLIAYSKTYLNHKVIIHNIRYKKLLSWGLLSFRLITFRWSFWSIDFLKRPMILIATGSLRATVIIGLMSKWSHSALLNVIQVFNQLQRKPLNGITVYVIILLIRSDWRGLTILQLTDYPHNVCVNVLADCYHWVNVIMIAFSIAKCTTCISTITEEAA